jgi:hypothetical protein
MTTLYIGYEREVNAPFSTVASAFSAEGMSRWQRPLLWQVLSAHEIGRGDRLQVDTASMLADTRQELRAILQLCAANGVSVFFTRSNLLLSTDPPAGHERVYRSADDYDELVALLLPDNPE